MSHDTDNDGQFGNANYRMDQLVKPSSDKDGEEIATIVKHLRGWGSNQTIEAADCIEGLLTPSKEAAALADKLDALGDDGSEGNPWSQEELDLIIAALRRSSFARSSVAGFIPKIACGIHESPGNRAGLQNGPTPLSATPQKESKQRLLEQFNHWWSMVGEPMQWGERQKHAAWTAWQVAHGEYVSPSSQVKP